MGPKSKGLMPELRKKRHEGNIAYFFGNRIVTQDSNGREGVRSALSGSQQPADGTTHGPEEAAGSSGDDHAEDLSDAPAPPPDRGRGMGRGNTAAAGAAARGARGSRRCRGRR